ncbi:MAG: GNAT family N-acetyltransferase [Bacteroidota bacterium]
MPLSLIRTDAQNADFRQLVALLDAHLAITDEDEHDFYHQYNGIEDIKYVIMAYLEEKPIGCGAIKHFAEGAMEVKRMYTAPEQRGQGIAGQVLGDLENWARELGYARCLLETGIRQPYAIRLYEKHGYTRIPNYGQYAEVENSVCMEKKLL